MSLRRNSQRRQRMFDRLEGKILPPTPVQAYDRLQDKGSIGRAAKSLHISVHAVTWALTQGGFPLVPEHPAPKPLLRCPECYAKTCETTCPFCHTQINGFLEVTPDRHPPVFTRDHKRWQTEVSDQPTDPGDPQNDDLPEDDPDPDLDA